MPYEIWLTVDLLSELPEILAQTRTTLDSFKSDGQFEANMARIRELSSQTRTTLDSLKSGGQPGPTRQQALTALHAIASGANNTREQYQDFDTVKAAIERLPW